ncbi:MAG: UDP-N-acetylmuramoyl-tripeptide--D-alanyl-D-alanine ligase [Peptostreptococcaceae bacterium]|nr:UDP-N-acetylmuramoyl-tripeptide--D-alanyl-D-alanine ligase [Peptostreptococcaceae bacterium]
MKDITVNQLAGMLGVILNGRKYSEKILSCLVIDSRKVKPGDAFIALKGPSFDGHDFIADAVEKGAIAVVSERSSDVKAELIIVEDTKKAISMIAREILKKVNPLVIAVTGSTGKTTTKEMIYCALKEKYNVHKTHANLNNDIGLPLTLFELENEHEIVVLEMGMNTEGEIRLLASIAEPDIAVITNIGESHIGRLGSKENIFAAKMEICENMDKESVLIANGDDFFLRSLIGKDTKYRKVFTSISKTEECDIYANDVDCGEMGSKFILVHGTNEYPCVLSVKGRHNVSNALLAFTAALQAGVEPELAVKGIEKYEGNDLRGATMEVGGMILVNDTYNANPSSMIASLESFSNLSGRKIAVFGDMLELGSYAKKMHMEVGMKAVDEGIDIIMVTGIYAGDYEKGAVMNGFERNKVHVFENNDSLVKGLKETMKPGDAILFKGSHSTRMNEVYKEILKHA